MALMNALIFRQRPAYIIEISIRLVQLFAYTPAKAILSSTILSFHPLKY